MSAEPECGEQPSAGWVGDPFLACWSACVRTDLPAQAEEKQGAGLGRGPEGREAKIPGHGGSTPPTPPPSHVKVTWGHRQAGWLLQSSSLLASPGELRRESSRVS